MANRTVSVELNLKAQQYKTEAEEAKVRTEGLKDSVKETDKQVDKLGRDSVKAAAELKALGVAAGDTKVKVSELGPAASNVLGTIDQKLKETKESASRFAATFNATGDMQAFMSWKKALADVSDLEKLRTKLSAAVKDAKDLKDKLTDDNGKKGFFGSLFDWTGVPSLMQKISSTGLQAGDFFGKSFGQGFFGTIGGVFKAMPPELQVVVGGIVAGIIAGSLSAIAAMVNGLLLSGIGLGGIGALIVGQLHSPQVRGAVQGLGHDLMNQLGAISAPFGGRLSAGVGVIDTGLGKLLTSLTPALQGISNAINPLAQGLAKMLAALGPGLSKALEAAMPLLLIFAKQLPLMGAALSDMFTKMSQGKQGAAEGLIYFFQIVNTGIRVIGEFVKIMSGMFQGFIAFADWMSGFWHRAFGWIPILGDWVKTNHDMFHGMRSGLDAAGQGFDNLANSLSNLNPDMAQNASLVQQAAQAYQNLSKGLDAAFNRTMGVDQATLQLNQSMLGLADSVQKNGTSLKENTKEGQANLGVIQQSISAINSLRDANIANGMSIDDANGKYQDQLNQLQQNLIKLGFSKDAVKALIDQYRGIPSQVSTVVNVLGLDAANTKLDSITQKFNELNGKVVTTYVVTDTTTGQTSTHTYSRGIQRWGGIREYAEMGLLNAGIYSSASPARYAFAEPATGGEAFVPRFGDYGRSTAILDQAARWYGGRFAAGGMGTVINIGGVTVNAPVGSSPAEIGARVVEVIRQYERAATSSWRN